jgi:hypothetical protein
MRSFAEKPTMARRTWVSGSAPRGPVLGGPINEPGDEHEREADRIAERVVGASGSRLRRACACGGGCPRCRAGQPARTDERQGTDHVGTGDAQRAAPSARVREVLRSAGRPPEPETRDRVEARFGYDFGRVRVHVDSSAAASAAALQANAYTVGREVVSGAGRYAPGTAEEDRLLAHELTHVVQQSGGRGARGGAAPLPISASGTRIQRDTAQAGDYRSKLKQLRGAAVALSNGVMIWSMWVVKGGNQVVMSISFSPYPKYRGKAITFLQTVLDTGGSRGSAEIDVLTYGRAGTARDDTSPFYGAVWSAQGGWVADVAPAPFRNQPGGPSDPNAYFFDSPMVYPGQTKTFETAVIVPETAEVLGFITWGAEGREGEARPIFPSVSGPSDRPTAGFLVAVDQYYGHPSTVGPDTQRPERYDAILDRFPPNDATLTADQKKALDPIAAEVTKRNDSSVYVSVSGFADATEKDPSGISEARARAVESYLLARGVPKAGISMDGFFGAAWARFAPGPKEDRNRRVQVRVHWGPPRP